ncbi:MAG TPA: alanine racemase [Abditibacteriaceae bacterium]|nr:alanine racemase [Abditibacteriaceae bacterium]
MALSSLDSLLTPALLLDIDRMQSNISAMQSICDTHGVDLRPHIKTHKMIEAGRHQLAAGAKGFVSAKLSEAEALLPSGVRSIFIAHSLVGPVQAPRLRRLAASLDELVVACTSEAHAVALEELLAAADLRLPVMMAIDTGLGREGARGLEGASRLAQLIQRQPHMNLYGLYTHEGHLYSTPIEESDQAIAEVHRRLLEVRDAIQSSLDAPLQLWPGCSVSAARMATLPEVSAVRPGAYIFGDLSHAETTQVMDWEQMAVTILATVVDHAEPGLALIDAGLKMFSSDRTPRGVTARPLDRRDLVVMRCSEEHGFVTGEDVPRLKIGERLRLVPAHICTVINLANSITVISNDEVVDQWNIDARGCVQ